MASRTMLTALGAVAAAYLAMRLSSVAFRFLRPSSLPRYLHSSTPSWALVTGASDGIGKAVAYELCRRGFNVVLHGRNRSKLATVRDGLLQAFPPREVRMVVQDAAHFTASALPALARSIADVHLTVLVNNVGGVTPILGLDTEYRRYVDITPEQIDGLINVNARFTALLTHALLPSLTRHTPSLVINIGSQAELGFPWLATYGGTKGFLHSWSHALRAELQADGADVDVLYVRVGSVQAGPNQGAPSWWMPTAPAMARSALNRVGCGQTSINAYAPHALQMAVVTALPEWLLDRIVTARLRTLAAAATARLEKRN